MKCCVMSRHRSPVSARLRGAFLMTHGPLIALALTLIAGHLAAQAGEAPDLAIAGGDAVWTITNSNGTSNGLPSGGSCNDSPGFGVSDGVLINGSQSDALDHGAMIWVNDEIFVAPGPPAAQGESVSAGPALMSGLNVSVDYTAVPPAPGGSQNVLRTLATFQNPSGSPISATITLTTNLGSDSGTEIIGSSTGDTVLTTQDRWVITDDVGGEGSEDSPIGIQASGDGDPANTQVLFGPGNPAETTVTVSETVFTCFGPEGILATFDLTVPAGVTQRLMFFNTLEETGEAALDNSGTFDTTPGPGGGGGGPTAPAAGNNLLAGLTETQVGEIVNWDFPGGAGVELTPLLLVSHGTLQVNRFRNSFVAVARRQRGRGLTGQVQYMDFANRVTFRSTGLTNALALGDNGVRLQGLGRVNSGPVTPFTADVVDNPGDADTFGITVVGGPNIPSAPIRSGMIRLRRP